MVLIWSFVIWFTQVIGHTWIIINLDEKISWIQRPLLRGAVGLVSMVVYASLAFILAQIFLQLVFFQELPSGGLGDWIENSWFAVKIAFVASFIMTFLGFLNAFRKSEIEKEKLKTQMMVHKYNALQNQINPHFLFNSFNVLSELVYEDQKLAVEFIRQLSDLYRYVLKNKNEDLVSLEEELEFVRSFSFLLQNRFLDQIEFTTDIEALEGEQIVPMTLQLLVENAVKHNEATRQDHLIIRIYRSEGDILVENNIHPKLQPVDSTKKGMEIIRERYAYLGQGKVRIEKTEKTYRVYIPILKVER
jgi:LytS/YehU family sensor histidine kinase